MFNLGQFFQDQMAPMRFDTQLKCYSAVFLEDADKIEKGGKIILPNSALDTLTRINLSYPMLFKITNIDPDRQRSTHCGVLEFVAEEGRCYIPLWMMKNLLLTDGELIHIESAQLPIATFVKFKPLSVDFLNITNPRAVLEMHLRNFACLTKTDVIAIKYNKKEYEFSVQEVKPGNAVSIIECDLNVDFDAPEGYVEPTSSHKNSVKADNAMDTSDTAGATKGASQFPGVGVRVDGKAITNLKKSSVAPDASMPAVRGVPNYDYKPGKLNFIRISKPLQDSSNKAVNKENADGNTNKSEAFEAFSGSGRKLKDKTIKK